MRHVLKFLTRLPLPVLYALGAFAYFVTFHVLRWHRELAARNLRNAFPEKSEAERARNPRARSATLRTATRTDAPARAGYVGGRAA